MVGKEQEPASSARQDGEAITSQQQEEVTQVSQREWLESFPLARIYGWQAAKHRGAILYISPPRKFEVLRRHRLDAIHPADLHPAARLAMKIQHG